MVLTELPPYLRAGPAVWAHWLPAAATWDLASVHEAAGDESRNHVNYGQVLFYFKSASLALISYSYLQRSGEVGQNSYPFFTLEEMKTQKFNDSPGDLGEAGLLDRVRFSMWCVWLPLGVLHLCHPTHVLGGDTFCLLLSKEIGFA